MSDRRSKTAIETAYAYLASRMRTESEVRKHLRDKGYTDEEIQNAVTELTELNYLDDYQYALRYYEYNREKKRGSARAARELAEKGVNTETIRNARDDYLFTEKVNEYEDALAVAVRELQLRTGDNENEKEVPDDKLLARIARKLDGKGYERGDIFKVLETLRSGPE